MEVADYCIRQWMDVKDNVRRYGVDSPKVFNRENIRPGDEGKPEPAAQKKGNKSGSEKQKGANKEDGSTAIKEE